jgi:ankyrin repeat protein
MRRTRLTSADRYWLGCGKGQRRTRRSESRGMLRAFVGTLMALAVVGCSHRAGGVDIWEAVEHNDVAAIKKFKAAGGDVNVRSWGGSTALWLALEGKKRYSYEALLERGADPNVIMSGKRVVTHWAALEEEPWWLRVALEHGADPNPVNVGRGRPLLPRGEQGPFGFRRGLQQQGPGPPAPGLRLP